MKWDDLAAAEVLIVAMVIVVSKLTGSRHIWPGAVAAFLLVFALFLVTGGNW